MSAKPVQPVPVQQSRSAAYVTPPAQSARKRTLSARPARQLAPQAQSALPLHQLPHGEAVLRGWDGRWERALAWIHRAPPAAEPDVATRRQEISGTDGRSTPSGGGRRLIGCHLGGGWRSQRPAAALAVCPQTLPSVLPPTLAAVTRDRLSDWFRIASLRSVSRVAAEWSIDPADSCPVP